LPFFAALVEFESSPTFPEFSFSSIRTPFAYTHFISSTSHNLTICPFPLGFFLLV